MYQIQGLLKFPKLFHAFSEKADGNMANSILGKLQDINKILPNRKRFLSGLEIKTEDTICLWVVHGDEVIKAEKKFAGKSIMDPDYAIKVDGMVTNEENLYLFLLIADCLPVILFDPEKSAVGLVHVGWKGADSEIIQKAVKKMNDAFGSNPQKIIIGFGPAARKNSFIKKNPSQLNDPKWETFIERADNDDYKVDFVGLCRKQLISAGIDENNIYDCGVNTVTDKRFFSHVREGKLPSDQQGRFVCVVGLKNH